MPAAGGLVTAEPAAPEASVPTSTDASSTLSTVGTIRAAVALVWSAGRRQLTIILLTTVVTSLAIAGQLLVGRTLLDRLADNEHTDAGELAGPLLVLGALMLIGAVSQAVAGELRIPLGELVERRAMDEVFDVSTEVGLESYESPEFADRMRRARMAAVSQSTAVVFGLVTIVSTALVMAGVLVVLIAIAPVLVPIALAGYLPIAWVNVRNNRARHRLETSQTELQRERGYLEYLMTEPLEAKEIRAYGTAPVLRRWYGELWVLRMAGLHDLVRKRLALSTLATVLTTVVLIGTLSLVLILTGRGSLTIGDAAVAIVSLQQLSSRLQSAGNAISGVHEGVTFLGDFETFRASLPAIRESRPRGTPPTPPSTVSVDHVGYRYPGASADAVRDVSFELARGQVMAIVGANGSGKTTLSKLLCDLLPPARGTVAWDGVDLAGCDPSLVRAQIAPVFQDYAQYLFTIRRTIGLGDTTRLDDEGAIWSAAQAAGVDELIRAQPDGLDARLGKIFTGGTELSIGQWQRMAIARALFRDAPMVLLDEPSASLDPRAEADLFDLLRSLCHDRIVIFVSHRFATVRDADVVLVLDQGEVVETGSHDELMAAGGLYHDLFELQAARYGMAG